MSFFGLLRKELRTFFVSPLFYVVAAVFFCLSGFFFYTQLIYFVQYGFGVNIVGSFWVAFLAGAPYSVSMVLLVVMPLLTMRSFAEEKRLGTIELLMTYPLRDGTIVAAKYCACAAVLLVLLLGTAIYPLFLLDLQMVPWMPFLSGYLGLALLGLSFIACGLFVSALTESQVIAAIGTLGTLLLFWWMTWNEAAANASALRVLRRFAMFEHFQTFALGVIDAGDLAYFVAFSAFFVFLTLRVLESRHWRGQR
jgi:gliding motility-associated transport system permease protein